MDIYLSQLEELVNSSPSNNPYKNNLLAKLGNNSEKIRQVISNKSHWPTANDVTETSKA